VVGGHSLTTGDLRVMYAFEGEQSEQLALKYEAHSDNDILILLDTTPDQSMVDEGTAREIINRIQKLRKKVGLVPSDEVIIYCSATPADSDIARVAATHHEYIENTIKMPVKPITALKPGEQAFAQEAVQFKGCEMKIVIVKSTKASSSSKINCSYVNVEYRPADGGKGRSGTILLENPQGKNLLKPSQLNQQVECLFGLQNRGVHLSLSADGNTALSTNGSLSHLSNKTIYAFHKPPPHTTTHSNHPPQQTGKPCCRFVNVECGSEKGSVLLENPHNAGTVSRLTDLCAVIFEQKVARVCSDKEGSRPVSGDITCDTLYIK